jgi:hypothetical protein
LGENNSFAITHHFHSSKLYKCSIAIICHHPMANQACIFDNSSTYTLWIFITKQLDDDNEVEMGFQLSIIKPKICNWMYTTWQHNVANPIMVAKYWNKLVFSTHLNVSLKHEHTLTLSYQHDLETTTIWRRNSSKWL